MLESNVGTADVVLGSLFAMTQYEIQTVCHDVSINSLTIKF